MTAYCWPRRRLPALQPSLFLHFIPSNEMATTFPQFNYLPEEIRRHIWVEALPGPRIVYVQRFLKLGQGKGKGKGVEEEEVWSEEKGDYTVPTYFGSKSPDGGVRGLLGACVGRLFCFCFVSRRC